MTNHSHAECMRLYGVIRGKLQAGGLTMNRLLDLCGDIISYQRWDSERYKSIFDTTRPLAHSERSENNISHILRNGVMQRFGNLTKNDFIRSLEKLRRNYRVDSEIGSEMVSMFGTFSNADNFNREQRNGFPFKYFINTDILNDNNINSFINFGDSQLNAIGIGGRINNIGDLLLNALGRVSDNARSKDDCVLFFSFVLKDFFDKVTNKALDGTYVNFNVRDEFIDSVNNIPITNDTWLVNFKEYLLANPIDHFNLYGLPVNIRDRSPLALLKGLPFIFMFDRNLNEELNRAFNILEKFNAIIDSNIVNISDNFLNFVNSLHASTIEIIFIDLSNNKSVFNYIVRSEYLKPPSTSKPSGREPQFNFGTRLQSPSGREPQFNFGTRLQSPSGKPSAESRFGGSIMQKFEGGLYPQCENSCFNFPVILLFLIGIAIIISIVSLYINTKNNSIIPQILTSK